MSEFGREYDNLEEAMKRIRFLEKDKAIRKNAFALYKSMQLHLIKEIERVITVIESSAKNSDKVNFAYKIGEAISDLKHMLKNHFSYVNPKNPDDMEPKEEQVRDS